MNKLPTYRQANPFGDATAENDEKMLSSAFLTTPDFRTLIESDDRTIVVGRRGTGKSALFSQLRKHWNTDKKILVLGFSPNDTEIIGFRAILKPFAHNFNLARAVTKIIWKYAMLLEILLHISQHYKLSKLLPKSPIVDDHLKTWNSTTGDVFRRCRLTAKQFLDEKDPEATIGDLHYHLHISEIEKIVVDCLTSSDLEVKLLMDRLDEGYESDNIGIGVIAGITYASIELNNKTSHIRPIIFLRDNIFRTLSKEDPDYSRNLEGQVIRLHWDWAQLLALAAKRMRVTFNIDKEKDQKVWDTVTANDLQGRNGFKKCLQFTLYRPRDLLSLMNESFYNAFKENRNVIINSDVDSAAKTISVARLDDLCKEYNKIFPSIQIVTSHFKNIDPELTVYSCSQKIEASYETAKIQNNPQILSEFELLKNSGILQSLYSVGFIGIANNKSSSFAFCHDGRTPDKIFDPDDKILIHPCYWIALNLNKNTLTPEEAENINDEYDINIISDNPEIRNKRIGQIISNLNSISEGRDGASEFEQWCVDALRIIFAAHLTDIRKHPNGDSVQRRDITGTNNTKSDFWKRVLEDYSSRHVVFDAKNYKELSISDYRQLQSYLTGLYGKLGFIINRDDKEELTGKNLDWTKEMYNSHSVLIIKLPAKFIIKLLQKLRSPDKHDVIDMQMSKLLTTYETLYLSLRSSKDSSSKSRKKS